MSDFFLRFPEFDLRSIVNQAAGLLVISACISRLCAKCESQSWVVLLSADDMSVMDCQRSKQKLILPIHITVIMFYLSHLYTVAVMS